MTPQVRFRTPAPTATVRRIPGAVGPVGIRNLRFGVSRRAGLFLLSPFSFLLSLPPAPADPAPLRLQGAVVDADTGRPLPARLYIEGPADAWHHATSAAPDGSAVPYSRERAGSVESHTTLSAHPFAADLPPGRYTITAERGKEYVPAAAVVDLAAGAPPASLRLRRWIDLAARGWYSGDAHVHRPMDELPNLVLAEDVNVALPIQFHASNSTTPPRHSDKGLLSPVPPGAVAADPTHVIGPFNSEYEIGRVGDTPHTLGAFLILGHRTPFAFGAPPVRPAAARARAEGALIDLEKHSWPWSAMLVPVLEPDLFELSNNHVWRAPFARKDFGVSPPAYLKIERTPEGFTERGWLQYGFETYYALLNCGFRLRPSAGTASGVHPVPMGFSRVYVRVDGPFSLDAWMAGLKAGRSFVTTGPMLMTEVDGAPPGTVFAETDARPRDRRVTGLFAGLNPPERIEIIVNGEIVRRASVEARVTPAGAFETRIEEWVRTEGSAWIAVRAFEKRDDGRVRFAHAGPVHIVVPSAPLRPRHEEAEALAARVEAEIARGAGILPAAALDEFREAAAAYRKLAEGGR